MVGGSAKKRAKWKWEIIRRFRQYLHTKLKKRGCFQPQLLFMPHIFFPELRYLAHLYIFNSTYENIIPWDALRKAAKVFSPFVSVLRLRWFKTVDSCFKVKGEKAKRNYTFSIYFKVNRTRLIEKLNGIRIDPLKKEIWQEQSDTKSGSRT